MIRDYALVLFIGQTKPF